MPVPSRSAAQQRAAGIALAAKKSGKRLKPGSASAAMARMGAKSLHKFAATKRKGLPKRVKRKK